MLEGQPGTAKTGFARIIAEILCGLGEIQSRITSSNRRIALGQNDKSVVCRRQLPGVGRSEGRLSWLTAQEASSLRPSAVGVPAAAV